MNQLPKELDLPTIGDTIIPQFGLDQITTDELKSKSSNKPGLTEKQRKRVFKLLRTYSGKKNNPYVAFIASKKGKKFKYTYIKLTPNKSQIRKSKGKTMLYYHVLVNPKNNKVYKVLALMLPDTPEQLEVAKKWGLALNKKTKNSNSKNKSASDPCSYDEEWFWDSLCGCMSMGVTEVCAPSNDDEFEDDDQGGGDEDAPDYCDYFPNDACEEDPFPNDNDGTNGGTPPNNDSCPVGQVKAPNNECINGEKPCAGNPIKNPRIAAQLGVSGINGGREGVNRYKNGSSVPNKYHSGLDIENEIGRPFFSAYGGRVEINTTADDDLGYFVNIYYTIGEEEYMIRYAHLKEENRPANGSTISVGDVIGLQGTSGNLFYAINKHYARPHSHIQVYHYPTIGSRDRKNPENHISTKFNSDGTVQASTDC